MTDAKLYRLEQLHKLFLHEFDRRATDNATRLLNSIAKESRGITCTVPTANAETRFGYWRAMFEKAWANRDMARSMDLLEHMRLDDVKA